MSRACFLSSGGDPFLSLLVMKLWKKYWYEEIDKFLVCYNNHAGVSLEVEKEFCSRVIEDAKVELIFHHRGLGNGIPITLMTKCSTDDLIMLLEDDGFIYTKGKVNECFQRIESDLTDAVGSPRGSCGKEIWDRSKEKYGLDYSGYGDVGPNFWPNFLFCKRKDLLRTDMDFGSHTWRAGEYSKELDYTFKDINHGDTFVWACVQLRALGLRFHNVPQYHVNPTELSDKLKEEGNWREGNKPYWLHGGSLSAGWGGYLSGQMPSLKTDMEKMEMETRCAFWSIACDTTNGFDEFRIKYKEGIANLINKGGLDWGNVQAKINLFRELLQI